MSREWSSEKDGRDDYFVNSAYMHLLFSYSLLFLLLASRRQNKK